MTDDSANVTALEEKAVDQETEVYENKQALAYSYSRTLLHNSCVIYMFIFYVF